MNTAIAIKTEDSKLKDLKVAKVTQLRAAYVQTEEQFRISQLDKQVKEKLGEEFRMEAYFGEEIDQIEEKTLINLAVCFRDVFNESWGESWTIETALEEIKGSLMHQENQVNLATFLYKGERIVGFCWVNLFDYKALSIEHDMPPALSESEKKEGLERMRYFMEEIIKKEKVMFLRELGVLKEFRKDLVPVLIHPLFDRAQKLGYNVILLWTNALSKAFKWGLSLGFYPLHFFLVQNLLIMTGNIKRTLLLLEEMIKNPDKKIKSPILMENLCRYMCK